MKRVTFRCDPVRLGPLPWTLVAETPKSKRAVIFDGCDAAIGTLELSSHEQLIDVARLLEELTRAMTEQTPAVPAQGGIAGALACGDASVRVGPPPSFPRRRWWRWW